MIFYGAMGVILGGRIGYTLFYNFPAFVDNPISILHIHQGGMSFHGGMLGVFTGLYLFGRKYGMTFFQVSDFIAPWVPIGLGAGRIGNLINHELWGRPMETVMPWAFDYGDHIARHPSSLYQALTEGLLLFLILWWYPSKPRPHIAISAVFMSCYGSFRFVTEFYGIPNSPLGLLPLTAYHWADFVLSYDNIPAWYLLLRMKIIVHKYTLKNLLNRIRLCGNLPSDGLMKLKALR